LLVYLATPAVATSKSPYGNALQRLDAIADVACKETLINDLVAARATKKPGFSDGGLHYFKYGNENATVYYSGKWETKPAPPPGSAVVRRAEIHNIRRYLDQSHLRSLDRESIRKSLEKDDGASLVRQLSVDQDIANGEGSTVWFHYKGNGLIFIDVWCGH
jgi:hypothetical protein